MNIRVVAFEPERVDQASSNYSIFSKCMQDVSGIYWCDDLNLKAYFSSEEEVTARKVPIR